MISRNVLYLVWAEQNNGMLAWGFLSFDDFNPMEEDLEIQKYFKLLHPYISVSVIWPITDFAIITVVTSYWSGVKCQEHEDNHCLPSGAEVKGAGFILPFLNTSS